MSGALPPHLRVLLDLIDEPLLLVRPEGTVLGGNEAASRQFGIPLQDLPGRHLAEMTDPPWDKAQTLLRRVSGSRQSIIGALTVRRPDGTAIHWRCYGNLVQPAANGTPPVLSLRSREPAETPSPFLRLNRQLENLKQEVTRRQLAEARLQQVNARLEALVAQEVAAREQVQARLAQSQRIEALGQLAAGIAHDFNNVLQAVTGGLALLQARAENTEQVRRYAGMALEAANRGATITGRLLAFARRGDLRARPLDPGPVLAELKEILVPTLGPDITIHTAVAPGTPFLQADRGQLETALINFATNARDAMPDGGTLTITAAPDTAGASAHPAALAPGSYVHLTVTDTGTGMDQATLARAAEPFFTTKPVGRGTGLGLAMARGFAQQSGGGLAINSTPGRGTTVSVWLPATSPAADTGALRHPARCPVAPLRRVLLVDDDTLVREVLAQTLEESGYEVVQAPDGLAAMAWLDQGGSADLLITDFSMPGMNGLTLITEARRKHPALPALLLTGYADASVQLAAPDGKHANPPVLRKPVRNSELTERAAALLGAAGG